MVLNYQITPHHTAKVESPVIVTVTQMQIRQTHSLTYIDGGPGLHI